MLALLGSAPAAAAGAPDNTWQLLGTLPAASGQPLFALRADPAAPDHVLAGTAGGAIYKSTDAGATWKSVAEHLGQSVLALQFSPSQPGVVFAGTRGRGIWRSTDGGDKWTPLPDTAGRTVRAFDTAQGMVLAGTDRGVYVSQDGERWKATGPGDVNVSAIAATSSGEAPHLLIGSDAGAQGAGLPLYSSKDGGHSWDRAGGSMNGSSMVDAVAAWPSGSELRLVLGTNAGAFASTDGGTHWSAVTGNGTLPATDMTAVQPLPDRPDQYYVSSDGGASDSGGVWVTRDGGDHFSALKPPLPAVTALSVAPAATPIVYAATFRPGDHAVMLWSYRDAGGAPQAGAPVPTAKAPLAADSGATGRVNWVQTLFRGPEGPFLGVSIAAVLVLILAWVTYARRARRL